MKCILHIGIEKTGTTTLQNWLYQNRTALAAQGIALSTVLQHPNNRDMAAYFRSTLDDFAQMAGISSPEQKDRYFEGFIERLEREIEVLSANCTHMVFTSEHFHSRLFEADDIARLRDFLAAHFESTTVICYLREQSALRRSLYSTALKAEVSIGIEEFHPAIGPGHFYYDFVQVLGRWEDAFGRDNIRARLFDVAALQEGDVRRDFLKTALPFVAPETLVFEEARENESLSFLQARAFKAINRWRPFFRRGGGIDPVNMALKAAVLKAPGSHLGRLHSALNKTIFERFRTTNAEISRRYFDGQPLFTKPGESASELADEEIRLTLRDAGDLVEDLLDAVLRVAGGRILSEEEIDLLRDVALSHETGRPVSREQACRLLETAHRARPKGSFIAEKLREFSAGQK